MRFAFCVLSTLFLVCFIDSFKVPSSTSRQIRNDYFRAGRLNPHVSLQLKQDADVSIKADFDYQAELRRTGLWVASAAGFAGIIAATKGVDSAVEFCSGYLLEQCLSVDNLFVFIVLFDYFKVTTDKQDRVLSYGIVGGNETHDNLPWNAQHEC
jgi:hypothetical protein